MPVIRNVVNAFRPSVTTAIHEFKKLIRNSLPLTSSMQNIIEEMKDPSTLTTYQSGEALYTLKGSHDPNDVFKVAKRLAVENKVFVELRRCLVKQNTV